MSDNEEDIFKTSSDTESDSDNDSDESSVSDDGTKINSLKVKEKSNLFDDVEEDEDINLEEKNDDEEDLGDDDDDLDDDDDISIEDEELQVPSKSKKNTKIKTLENIEKPTFVLDDDATDYSGTDDDDDDDENEDYLQKFDTDIKKNYIVDVHPECVIQNYDEVAALSRVVRDKDNNIIDPLHKTIPILTKYERARVLGQRAKQINSGSRPFVRVPENVIDGYLIAEMELKEKRIPFIIRRPLPGIIGSEYWCLKDLEVI